MCRVEGEVWHVFWHARVRAYRRFLLSTRLFSNVACLRNGARTQRGKAGRLAPGEAPPQQGYALPGGHLVLQVSPYVLLYGRGLRKQAESTLRKLPVLSIPIRGKIFG